MFPLYRNQSIVLHPKSIYWFLYGMAIILWWESMFQCKRSLLPGYLIWKKNRQSARLPYLWQPDLWLKIISLILFQLFLYFPCKYWKRNVFDYWKWKCPRKLYDFCFYLKCRAFLINCHRNASILDYPNGGKNLLLKYFV